MKKALICDWLEIYSGAERCAQSFTNIWGDFDIFSLVDFLIDLDRNIILKGKSSKTSFIQNLPFSRKSFRRYLPLFSYAIEQFDLSGYDLILSSSHCVAKGVLSTHEQLHISYVHTPIRYAWDMYFDYLKEYNLTSGLKATLLKYFLHRLRIWDVCAINRVDKIIANSKFVSRRIEKIYNRDSVVIYPPVDTLSFDLAQSAKDEYYITCSRLVAYKRVDLIVRAFAKNGKKLVVIGEGAELESLKKLAKQNIEFLGYQSKESLKSYLQNAKAFVYAAVEDFGISVVEALSCGTAVIALRRGGVTESVISGVSGEFFDEPNETSLNLAIERFEKNIDKFDKQIIRKSALKFSKENFENSIKSYVEKEYEKFKNR